MDGLAQHFAAVVVTLCRALRARVEVGPSPEQIEAAARVIASAWHADDDDWDRRGENYKGGWCGVAEAALVAACSVRGTEPT